MSYPLTDHHPPSSSSSSSSSKPERQPPSLTPYSRSPALNPPLAAPKLPRSGLSRAVHSLLGAPQPSPSSSGRGSLFSASRLSLRNTVEPLVSSPLRISSSMASAPSSPERSRRETEDAPRRSLDHLPNDPDRPASMSHMLDLDEKATSNTQPIQGPPTPKKRKDKTHGRGTMAAVMFGLESKFLPKSFTRGRDSSREPSRRGSSLDSRSESSTSRRPMSPGARFFHVGSSKPSTDRSKLINMEEAHNKSDEALAKHTNILPDYVKPSEHEESGERLAKDVFDREKNMIESSEEEDEGSSSEEEHIPEGSSLEAGQKKGPDLSAITQSAFETPKGDKTPAASDEEQKSPGRPIDEKKPRKSALKATVHPQTSFDIQTPNTQSAANTPYGSEDEDEMIDIKRAQKLGISMSAIDNLVPNRSIRTIVRGDYNGLQEEADHGRLRQRKYLVATDLSEESVYALEWTIGTILRDGDTMFALYVLHEDSNMSSGQVGEGAKAIQDANAVVRTQTKEATQNTGGSRTILGRLGPGSTPRGSIDVRASPKAEAERVKAVEQVSNTCVKLLRKTLLQVRIAVEVIHCKNPKLLITEAVSLGSHYCRIQPANYDQVDELEPTLVIVGARGQSALKGVLLGSFSNYLLSNSSVPVMVARRKLKRHHSKGRNKTTVRLSNNLTTPKSLIDAKVD
ncbi:hypothetical protein N7510_006360 [Penicillium lagena]|uniref:uncharacterized protein n=1 Tax=Penicillium lagena TaxID=94218 RepID=UPI00254116B2|nr:uncharacterized protein N7510_006360 [Penicillium lagena]KAJ5613166.1 hypothetical protein N7510_006360 [Penicillium lagena]